MQAIFIRNADEVARHFHLCTALLQPVIDEAAKGEFTLDDLRDLTAKGMATTGMALDDSGAPVIAMVWEWVHYPRKTTMNIMALGGSGLHQGAEQFWPQVKAFAKAAGASAIEASCSPAMARMLRGFGFATAYQLVRAEI